MQHNHAFSLQISIWCTTHSGDRLCTTVQLPIPCWSQWQDCLSQTVMAPDVNSGELSLVGAVWLWTFQVSATVTTTTQRYICRPQTIIISIMDWSFFQLFWIVSLTHWTATLLSTTHHLDKGFTSSNSIFVVLPLMSQTLYILKLLKAVSTSTPLPYVHQCSEQKEGSTRHSPVDFRSTTCTSSSTDAWTSLVETWKVVTVKIVPFTLTQRAPSLNHVNVGWWCFRLSLDPWLLRDWAAKIT